jgi:hypothetical protein
MTSIPSIDPSAEIGRLETERHVGAAYSLRTRKSFLKNIPLSCGTFNMDIEKWSLLSSVLNRLRFETSIGPGTVDKNWPNGGCRIVKASTKPVQSD